MNHKPTHRSPLVEELLAEFLALQEVEAPPIMRTVEDLCSFGERLSNEAEHASMEYLGKAFSEAGLSVSNPRLFGYVSIPVSASLEVDGRGFECITHPMTPGTDGLRGRLAFIESPAGADSPEGRRKVRGAIVLTRGLATDASVRRLEAAGAAGVVFITGPLVHNMIVSRVWGSPTPADTDDYVGIPVASVSLGTGLELIKLDSREAVLHTNVENRWERISCLEADLVPEGHARLNGGYVLMTGHIDSWGPGALDNASGIATILETARFFARHVKFLKRGLRCVVWSGHSHGRYAGSTAYCDQRFTSLERHCVLNINCDCLGGAGATLMRLSPAMASTAGLARYALATAAGVTDWKGTHFTRSCDQSFWGAGVPSLFSQVSEQPPVKSVASEAFGSLFGSSESGGYGEFWHTSEDKPEHLDPDFLRRDAGVMLAAAAAALTSDEPPLDDEAELAETHAALTARAEQIEAVGRTFEKNGTKSGRIVRDACAELVRRIRELDRLLGSERPDGAEERMARLRRLIRINYAESDETAHPKVAPFGIVPCLDAVEDLQKARGADEILPILTLLFRKVNALFLKSGLELPEN